MGLLDGVNKQEFVSDRMPMPVDIVSDTAYVNSITGEAVQLYYFSTGVPTVDAGQAAGTVVVAKLAYTGILDRVGAMIGNDLETSLAWTTGTVLPIANIMPCPKFDIEDPTNKTLEEIATDITKNFATGEWCLDHRTGLIFGKKATTGTADTAAYKVQTQTTGGGTSIATSINIAKIGNTAVNLDDAAFAIGVDAVLPTGYLVDDSSTDSVDEGDTGIARMSADRVLYSQGAVAHDAADSGNPVKIGGKASTAKPTAVSNADRVNAYFDQFGRQHVYDEAGGGVGAGLTLYVFDSVNSMGQGQTAYTAATQVTVSGLSFTPNPRVLVKIEHYTSAGAFVAAYTPQQYTITYAAGVYTVTGAAFGATDLIVVYQQGPERTTNLSTNAQTVGEVNQINYQAVEESLQDTTNVAAATNYYPSALGAAMMGSKGLSLSGKFIDADGTMTLDVEVTDDEDATNADWISAGLSSIDQKTGIQTIAAALTVTNGTLTFAIKFPDLNFRFWRVKMVNNGATNTSIIKARRIAN